MSRHEYPSLRQGLVGAWCPSLGGGGSLLPDFGPRRAHLTCTSVALQGTSGGVAAETNGTSSVAQTTAVASVVNGSTTASVSCWLWRSATNQTVAAGFANSAIGALTNCRRFSAIWFTDGNIYVSVENGPSTFAFAPLSGTGWRHLTWSFTGAGASNATRLLVFVDGTSVTLSFTGTMPSSLSTDLGPFCVGKDSTDRFGAGRYDDLRVYNRALTLAEIRLLASRRGIGLTPLPDRAAGLPKKLFVNDAGTWRDGDAYVNTGSGWRLGVPSVNDAGTWR
jgi:hypothetical protein